MCITKQIIFFTGSKQSQLYEEDRGPLAYGQPRFRPDYNTPDGFRAGEEMKDKINDEWKELRRMEMLSKSVENSNRAYTEGGLVFLPRKGKRNDDEKTIKMRIIILGWVFIATDGGEEDEKFYNDFVKSYDSDLGWGFKRPERLDVKKPGPFYNTNNYAFMVSSS